MRLICPNCNAQYEVPENVIPVDGRDVQCSNCGHTWFQHHPDTDLGAQDVADAPLPAEDWSPDIDDEVEDAAVESPPPAARRELDPAVAEILREEAEREARARAEDAQPLESQPDLGLDTLEDEETRRARQARDRMARMRGQATEAEAAAAAAAAAASSRRDLFPDVDEVNSQLRSQSVADTLAEDGDDDPLDFDEPKPNSRFMQGMFAAFVVFAVLILTYLLAPQISNAVPALADALGQYSGFVDGLRGWLNNAIASGLTALGGLGAEPAS